MFTVAFTASVTHTCPPPDQWGFSDCGWFTKMTTVPAGQACSDFGTHVWVGPLEDGAVTRSYTDTYLAVAPADEIACLYLYEGGAYTLVAQSAPYHVGAPAPTPPPPGAVGDPAAGLSSELIPTWVAPRRRDETFIISTASIPPDVRRDRFVAIARSAGERWDLGYYDTTRRRLKLGNWETELGFVWNLPSDVLGRQVDMVSARYRPRRRICRGGRCWWRKRKVISRELVDRDVAINAAPPLAEGPAYPTADQIDLETVVLHELGHLARVRR